MARRSIIISLLAIALPAAVIAACASSSGVQKSERWAPYPGCNARQCKSWYEECAAECMNKQTMSVSECENKCQANVPSCESSCAG